MSRWDRIQREAADASHDWIDVAAGLEVYRRATERDPDDPEPWFLYGGALAALERWSEAGAVARDGLRAAGFDQDLWLLSLDSLVAEGRPELVDRELDDPIGRAADPLIEPLYRARAEELRGGPTDAILGHLGRAYEAFTEAVRPERAPQQQLLDLAQALARCGSRDEADHVLDVMSRRAGSSDEAWRAAATGVALWDGVDDDMVATYLDRVAEQTDRSEEEIAEAIEGAAEAMRPPAPANDDDA